MRRPWCLVLLFTFGCSSQWTAPLPEPRSKVEYYLLKDNTLMGEAPEQDRPITDCGVKENCYVYREEAHKSMLKYIINLEETLRDCQRTK